MPAIWLSIFKAILGEAEQNHPDFHSQPQVPGNRGRHSYHHERCGEFPGRCANAGAVTHSRYSRVLAQKGPAVFESPGQSHG